MRLAILTLFFYSSVFGQTLNVRDFGATGNGSTDDHAAIQAAVDSAVKISGTVYIPKGRYKISQPIFAYQWTGSAYGQVGINIIGESTMWDQQNRTVILPTFKDKFVFGVQAGKGCIFRGITIQGLYRPPAISAGEMYKLPYASYGDSTCRDTRFSPFVAFAVDPFINYVPSDGGYPGMSSWYRGQLTRSGSTGLRFEDISITGVNLGFIISPNGYTQNGDIITFDNIRMYDLKAGFAGCQAQEKLIRVKNVGMWGVMHTLFVFNRYGAMQPGNWYVDGVNIAGSLANFINRQSGGWFPSFFTNIFAESIYRIGDWQSGCGDVLSNSTFNFRYVDQIGYFPDSHLSGNGVTLTDLTLRYYGGNNDRIYFNGLYNMRGISSYRPVVQMPVTSEFLEYAQQRYVGEIINNRVKIAGCYEPGSTLVFVSSPGWSGRGIAQVESTNCDSTVIRYISPSVLPNRTYSIAKLRS